MPPKTAIEINIYSGNDELKDTHRRLIVPWGFLKRAIRLSKDLNSEDVTEEQIDAISDLLVSLFGDAFTREELENGADVAEILACFRSIVARAQGIIPNPPPPPS